MVYYIPRWRKLIYFQFSYWDYLSSRLTLSRKNSFRIGERSNSHWGNNETDFIFFYFRRLQLVFMHENHPTGCSTGIVKSNMLMRELWNTKYELGLVFSFHWDVLSRKNSIIIQELSIFIGFGGSFLSNYTKYIEN